MDKWWADTKKDTKRQTGVHNDFQINLVLLEFIRYFRQNLVVLKFDR